MAVFPNTPRTLIRSLGELADRADEAHWARFVELYEPAIREFVRLQDPDIPAADRDDLVQEAFARLVPALRNRVFDPGRGRFRNFLATVVRRLMIDRLRARAARRTDGAVPLDDVEPVAETPAAAELVDMKWRLARHHAAVEHVFAKSALSERSRRVYLMSEVDGLAMKDIAVKLGLASNAVRRIVSRVRRMIAAVEAEYE